MTSFVIRRIVQLVVVLFFMSVLVFVGMRVLADDSIHMLASDQQAPMTQAQIEQLRHGAGLDRNAVVQYGSWVGGLFKGDMGRSILYQTPVASEIARRLPITLEISLLGWIIGTLIGILGGVMCAVKRGTWADTLVSSLANVGASVPIFFLGLLLVYVLALWLNWLPVQGFTSPFVDFGLSVRQIIMPLICLAIFPAAVVCRQTRSALLGGSQGTTPLAWPKGLRRRAVILRQAFGNSHTPVVAFSGLTFAAVIGWAMLVETIFNMPGLGRLAVTAVYNLDYPYIQGTLVVIATVVLVVGFFLDLLRVWLDRRSDVPRGDMKADVAASDPYPDAGPALGASGFARFRTVFLARPVVRVGLVILAVFLLSAIFAPLIAPHNPHATDGAIALQSPSRSHPLGTDQLGRDTLSRLIYASRAGLIIGVSVAAIAAIVGGLLGLVAGFLGGWVNLLIMRVMEAVVAIPIFLLALVIIVLLDGGIRNVIIALSVGMVPLFAWAMRGIVLRAKEDNQVLRVRPDRARHRFALFTQVFRNCLRPFIALMVTMVGAVVLVEGGLSFLGAERAGWGSMINDGRLYLSTNPLLMVAPGVVITLVVFALYVVGDGLRDMLDPRLRGITYDPLVNEPGVKLSAESTGERQRFIGLP